MLIVEILGLTCLFFRIIFRYDPGHGLRLNRKSYLLIGMLACVWGGFLQSRRLPAAAGGLYGILAAYLLTATVTDLQIKKVHDFLAIIGGLGGLALCIMEKPEWAVLKALGAFLVIQFILFRKMYGLADCLAFAVCALYMAASGKDLITYLLHMGAAFLALFAAQAMQHNINSHGNLKKPVALLPYISTTVWFFL